MVRYILFLLLFGFSLVSCKENRLNDIDISEIDVEIEVQRFEKDLFAVNPDSLQSCMPVLKTNYGQFVDLFCEGIIRIGKPENPQYYNFLKSFLTDTMVANANKRVQDVFPNLDELNKTLTDAFKRYRYHFPTRTVPKVFTYISGYNLSVAIDENTVAVGLDRYLGSNTPQYKMLGIPLYMAKKMIPQKVSSDIIRAWLYGEFTFNDSVDNLLANMIYEGQLIYITKNLLPNEQEQLIHGFSKEQLKWCLKNENDMWTHLIENKLLFSTNTLEINKFINDAPFTSGFPQESPGRAAVWMGYRIVESFMERNNNLSLNDLMQINDYQKILNMAKYKP